MASKAAMHGVLPRIPHCLGGALGVWPLPALHARSAQARHGPPQPQGHALSCLGHSRRWAADRRLLGQGRAHQQLRAAGTGRGRCPLPTHRSPRRLRRRGHLRRRPRVRLRPRGHQGLHDPARRVVGLRLGPRLHRLVPRPAHGLFIRRQPGGRKAGHLPLQRQQPGRQLGRRLGRAGGQGRGGLARRIPHSAVAAAIQLRRRRPAGIRRGAQRGAGERDQHVAAHLARRRRLGVVVRRAGRRLAVGRHQAARADPLHAGAR